MSKWIKDGRPNENVGGGFFVFRRGAWSNRIRPSKNFPFEHATLEAAQAEAQRLAASRPGSRFDVVGIISSVAVPAPVVAEQVAGTFTTVGSAAASVVEKLAAQMAK